METKEYTVTDQAGPRVAGRAARKGEVLELTEAQASAELLSGAIVPKGKEAKEGKPSESSKRLEGIQARAKGFDTPAEAQEAEEAEPQQAPPAEPGKPAGKPPGGKPAGDAPAA